MSGVSYETRGHPLPWNLLRPGADHPTVPWDTGQLWVLIRGHPQQAARAYLQPQLQPAHLQGPGQSFADWQLLSLML